MRAYLALPPRQRSADVMRDALRDGDPGALQLIHFILETRVNRRSRRSLATVTAEYAKVRRAAWFGLLEGWVWSLYRLSLISASHF